MHFDKREVQHLSRLCKIECSEEELDAFLFSLDAILSHVEQLNTIDTRGVKACTHVIEYPFSVLGEDEIEPSMPHERLIKNAPDSVGGMVRVPTVLNS